MQLNFEKKREIASYHQRQVDFMSKKPKMEPSQSDFISDSVDLRKPPKSS